MVMAGQHSWQTRIDPSWREFHFSSVRSISPPERHRLHSVHRRWSGNQVRYLKVIFDLSPLICMLQYIHEQTILKTTAKLVFHYLIGLRRNALFVDTLFNIKRHFGDSFDAHIWITRQEPVTTDPSPFIDDLLTIHNYYTSELDQVGETWDWWDLFINHSLQHFETKNHKGSSLVYICGPQGLTDKLVDLYQEKGIYAKEGHLQIEKWW